jgi:hypothetical protein
LIRTEVHANKFIERLKEQYKAEVKSLARGAFLNSLVTAQDIQTFGDSAEIRSHSAYND